MATIEFINKRIDGKKKEIEKLTKKLDRINKAKATNWEVNPYYYSDSDLRWTTRDLEQAKEALAKYEADLAVETEKENSRNIKVILDFLEAWKQQVTEYYVNHVDKWIETLRDYYEADSAYCKWLNSHWAESRDKELRKQMSAPAEKAKAIHARYNYFDRYMERKNGEYTFNGELLKKDLDEEANLKYDFIIERTNAIVGQITDASSLTVGDKGDLNGFIIGSRGTAKVQTIGAGGYNIQCYHFRTLINKVA